MSPHIAIAHYPEGAGHATRMMAIARGLERRGATVTLAGGGPGRRFYELNGYTVEDVTYVDYVRDFQEPNGTVRGLGKVLTNSLPSSANRIRELSSWLRREDPDAIVTDDMFAAVAATVTRTPLYVLSHNSGSLYRNPVVKSATSAITAGQRISARRYFYPTVWPPHPGDPTGVSRIPPVALDPPTDDENSYPSNPGVLVSPSVYSSEFEGLGDDLRTAGYHVTDVTDSDWTPVPSLLPVLERADACVCAGYSTIMEAAVAGTPCIVCPSTNEQFGVARRLEGLDGFVVVEQPEEIRDALDDPPEMPTYPNGVAAVAERVLDALGAGQTEPEHEVNATAKTA